MELLFNEINQLSNEHYSLLLDADPSKKLVDDYTYRGFTYEVLLNETLVGVVVLLPTRPETLEIVNVAVHPNYQKQGIGQKIILFAIGYAKRNNYRSIEIGTGSTSLGQLYLYQKMDFRITGVDTDFFVHHYSEEIMENGLVLKDMIRLRLDI
ncbi:MAG: GNAT family N-acetyltransferase [Vagococcus sp.]|uniref:GNAT family N-acetyltransferase n=1 Tax=Vagococcus sp. TaxID=1933889 RepID=UPI002FCADFAF